MLNGAITVPMVVAMLNDRSTVIYSCSTVVLLLNGVILRRATLENTEKTDTTARKGGYCGVRHSYQMSNGAIVLQRFIDVQRYYFGSAVLVAVPPRSAQRHLQHM